MTQASDSTLRAANPADRAEVVALLHAEGLSAEGLDPALAGFRVVEEGGRVVAVAGLERYGDFALLRSVAVSADRRGLGLGGRLTRAVVADARAHGLAGVYALTTTAAGYFPRLGFEVIERTQVPAPVQASAEFSTICPASAVAFRLELASAS